MLRNPWSGVLAAMSAHSGQGLWEWGEKEVFPYLLPILLQDGDPLLFLQLQQHQVEGPLVRTGARTQSAEL